MFHFSPREKTSWLLVKTRGPAASSVEVGPQLAQASDNSGPPASQALQWDHQPGTLAWPGLQALMPNFSGSFKRDKGFGFSFWSRSWGRSSKEEISKSLSSSESCREVRGRRKCILTRENGNVDGHGNKMPIWKKVGRCCSSCFLKVPCL